MTIYKGKEIIACDTIREALELFNNSNVFIKNIQWEELFNKPIGSKLCIRMPNDYTVVSTISLQETVVLGTAAILIKNPIVSRRFWCT